MHRKIQFTITQLSVIFILSILFTSITVLAASGTTDAANTPGLTSSYTLEDIYQRLVNGTNGSQSAFTEPVVAPGNGTMHDLNDIMAAAPAPDPNGATTAQVLLNQSFWGLTNSQWGIQIGEITNGSNVAGADGNLSFTIPDGYYTGRTATASDSDLAAGNIMAGNNIFGVEGEVYGGCTCEGTMVGETGTRWCDNGDGTITDMLGYNGSGACLVWLKNAHCFETKPWTGEDNAHMATGFLRSGECGLSDGSDYGEWRLPTDDEFNNMINGVDPVWAFETQGFSNIETDHYWTRTSDTEERAREISFEYDPFLGSWTKVAELEVWPVRNAHEN